ncbi:MAG TPA: zinc-binding dehydrogenase, partial [Polyangiaceae bacterium]|nr:zinc-binding dehydrogenase [Polyangiaceae bacterium]
MSASGEVSVRLRGPKTSLGHRLAGDVLSVGADIERLQVGMRVTLDSQPVCDRCPGTSSAICALRPHLRHDAGANCVSVTGPLSAHLHEIPDALSYESAVQAGLVASVAEATLTSGVRFGDTVVILGSGAVALLHVQLSRLRGATQVICLVEERSAESRLVLAGAIPLDVGRGQIDVEVMNLTGGRGADVVFEAVGTPEAHGRALRMARRRGTVVAFGRRLTGPGLGVALSSSHERELSVLGSSGYSVGMFERCLRLLAAGSVGL